MADGKYAQYTDERLGRQQDFYDQLISRAEDRLDSLVADVTELTAEIERRKKRDPSE